MPRKHDVARFESQAIGHPLGIVFGLQVAAGTELCQGVARTPERLSGLLRAQLAAVPDHDRFRSARRGLEGQTLDFNASGVGKRTQRIDTRTKRFAVMYQIESQREDASRQAGATPAEVRCGASMDLKNNDSVAGTDAQRLRGWLLVLSRVLMIWEPLEFAVAASSAYNAIAVRGLPVVLVLAARLAGTVLSVAASRGLANRHPGSPTLAVAALALTGATRVFALVTPWFPSNRLPGQTPLYVALALAFYGGGIVYLLASQQARAIRRG